jgi:DNA-binding response OmpR family regulator
MKIHKASILLVDSELSAGTPLPSYLSSCNWDCTVVATAEQAFEAIDGTIAAFDIIIVETKLLGHGVLEFLQELRSYGDMSTVPCVILSVGAVSTQQANILQSDFGVVAIYRKTTISMSDFEQNIYAIVSRRLAN